MLSVHGTKCIFIYIYLYFMQQTARKKNIIKYFAIGINIIEKHLNYAHSREEQERMSGKDMNV